LSALTLGDYDIVLGWPVTKLLRAIEAAKIGVGEPIRRVVAPVWRLWSHL